MTFIIDTGAPGPHAAAAWRLDRVNGVRNGVLDSLPPDATQSQIDSAMVCMILGELRTPRTLKTVRRRLVQLWPLIAELHEREPDQFDSILTEFAEIASALG